MACATPIAGAPGGPAVTDATAASPEEMREAALRFLPAAEVDGGVFERASGGVNNKCAHLRTASGAQYLLRIYNNGENHARVAYEHAVLTALKDKKFSFSVPHLVPAIADGATMVRLSSGTDACLFVTIPGTGATLKAARGIGRATAELVAGLVGVHVPGECPNPLYRFPYTAHHAMTKERFLAQMGDACFDGCRAAADFLVAETLKMEALCDRIAAMEPPLPQQQIHADLHFQNVLCEGEVVTGVLDFEFSAYDWRVMELAVGLSKYIAMPDIEPVFEEWVAGYAEGGGRLSAAEVDFVPDAIIVRVLNNVIYFAGRIFAKEDAPECLTTRAEMYADRVRWIEAKREWMLGVLRAKLLE